MDFGQTHGVTGSVKVNGKERIVHKFRKQLSYITQEFAILDLLTARETLVVAADLKLNSDIGTQKKNEMVDHILDILGLEKVMNTPVAKLSGGEKKRLSIGVELLTNPPVMFFDEPTSGLDSSSALQVISHLKSLAEGGRTVVCSIHQPSSKLFQMFDDIYLIKEGQCLYSGPISDLTHVLGEAGFQCPSFYNRADFAIELASGERGNNTERLVAKFNNQLSDMLDHQQDGSSEETSILQPKAPNINGTAIQISPEDEIYKDTSYAQSVWRQFQVLCRRSFLCSLRDKIICPTVLLLPGYFLTDQPSDGTRFLQFWFICLLVSVIAHNQGLAAGALFNNPQVSIHTCNYVTHLKMVRAVVFSGLHSRTFAVQLERQLKRACMLSILHVTRRIRIN
ncbi:hypothetical protein Cfor_09619 [Coptotermes formosanus]|uniref:ABC transporter domain-containing protein n=1 Tax=Coptotermes formosanus TaxID=36987 RepID=A0A6L2PVE3_COPFO|nr:hypothetical protein Cfor_09619 [Coptotermes formosanus]